MPVETLILSTIATEVFKYLWEVAKERYKDRVSNALFGDPQKKAFERALKRALEHLETNHGEWVAQLFDGSFLAHEGAPVLALFLVRDGQPDPSEMAKLWADSLRLKGEQRTTHIRELEPVTADFFSSLSHALKAEPELSELHDSRSLEEIAANTAVLVQSFGTEKATPGTRYDYLRWIIDRNFYLDPRGIEQTQRQVQLRLNEIYVSLNAQREETPGVVDKRLLEKEMSELELKIARQGIVSEEAEDRREQLLAQHYGRQPNSFGGGTTEVLELHQVVSRHARLVILGDPGSGKTTLLRYLALMHAQASYDGRAEASKELGPTRFPIMIRIAAYAESGLWKDHPLSDYLAEYCTSHECPKSGMADLLRTELEEGNCLILLDGLDEIVSADDRRGIVEKIEGFINRYDNASNRFIVTSRIAGYRNAPLADPSVHFTVQDMDNNQIKRFLNNWCRAVEDAQTPELSPEIRAANAQREIDGILSALENSQGVRRLATNPLLLTILALIHRTGARLPEKRIQLYKLAADTLARNWRIGHGIPESALIEETYLTRLLSKLAYWLHINKPTGIATEQEVYNVLGEEWAWIKSLPWDADDPNPEIIGEVKKFLTTVREQTGLFVERAPRRYGFMHLTFEEYYVARHLVRRPKKAAETIRKHLHGARWEEPILLALGFVGMDFPDAAGELLETAILAQGEEAQELGFTPSEYEDILGRDFLFALRCLGDQIPAAPGIIKELIERLERELIYRERAGRFKRYQENLLRRLASLRGGDAESLIVRRLLDDLRKSSSDIRLKTIECFGRLENVSSEVIVALLATLKDEDKGIRHAAVNTLGPLAQTHPEVIAPLIESLKDVDMNIRLMAVNTLGPLAQTYPEVIAPLIESLKDEARNVRLMAVNTLGPLAQTYPEVIPPLIESLKDEARNVRRTALYNLEQLGQTHPEVIAALIESLKDVDRNVRYAAANNLASLGQTYPEVIAALIESLKDEDRNVRNFAALNLSKLGVISPQILDALRDGALNSESWPIRRDGSELLGQIGSADEQTIDLLFHGLLDTDNDVRRASGSALANLGRRFPDKFKSIATRLVQAINDPAFENLDGIELRPGQDYAFDALWLLVVGEAEDEESKQRGINI